MLKVPKVKVDRKDRETTCHIWAMFIPGTEVPGDALSMRLNIERIFLVRFGSELHLDTVVVVFFFFWHNKFLYSSLFSCLCCCVW